MPPFVELGINLFTLLIRSNVEKVAAAQRWPSAAARDRIQAEGIRLLEKHANAPSAARLCWNAFSAALTTLLATPSPLHHESF